eukprot:gnl/TRDRNA2_/TRDRNA2_62376_c0_seq1.p1 gnl/TRDRNA2_/TRDRNA2_62376_c0~~gnl/TRDRNA2_/TRDRNA2_62376_c0_seq1.p1  ORF type:complete len:516 (+),score=77.71 gnl/TRDRNA2_/TRDRNA2_62376_c0_seq1:67-1548(+)
MATEDNDGGSSESFEEQLARCKSGLRKVKPGEMRIAKYQCIGEPMHQICFSDDFEKEQKDCYRNALYLGGYDGASMHDALEVRNVRHVLSVLHSGARSPGESPAPGVSYWRSPPVEDSMSEAACAAMKALLDETLNQIDIGLANGSSVLVHCMMGVSRSATVVTAYVMRRLGVGWMEALIRVKRCRSVVNPNPGFQRCLGSFEATSSGRNRSKSSRFVGGAVGKPALEDIGSGGASGDMREVDQAASAQMGSSFLPFAVSAANCPRKAMQTADVGVGMEDEVLPRSAAKGAGKSRAPPPPIRQAPQPRTTYAQQSGYKARQQLSVRVPQDRMTPSDLSTNLCEDPSPKVATRQLRQLRHWQKTRLPSALAEIKEKGRKEGHWIWWAFPCNMVGDCEPAGIYAETTRLTVATALELAHDPPDIWREVLQILCALEQTERAMRPYLGMYHRGSALPSDDHPRVQAFIDFWERIPEDSRPDWLSKVIANMKTHQWC